MESTYSKEVVEKNYKQILENIDLVKKRFGIARNIKVVAVSKTHPVEAIKYAIEAGIRDFGENYAQELKTKYELLKQISDVQPNWHFIGHLQTNKVKYIIPFVKLIHSVDSFHLANEINRQAEKHNRVVDVLVQVNTSGEESKFGCEPEEALPLIDQIGQLPNLRVIGLMTIGSFSTDENTIRKEFRLLRSIFEEAKQKFPELPLTELSMGMTNDYMIAVEEGATILRIGTAIFGERHY
ncbi:YggS family pyridoxal phosphate-dependent enzyme [Bacteroidetes/Chlorobi group bacterium MS-B_bin-24]|nr:MAG: YggS family pyridoxal phosphate-dependent enzyme [Bacteroidetes/Chlorobi group bacterium MS-B_bin-24]